MNKMTHFALLGILAMTAFGGSGSHGRSAGGTDRGKRMTASGGFERGKFFASGGVEKGKAVGGFEKG